MNENRTHNHKQQRKYFQKKWWKMHLDVTFNLVIDSKKKRSKTKISDMITKQFPPFREFTTENGHDQMK